MKAAREQRRRLIRQIVRDEHVRTQNGLVDALRERGCDVTQATVSRDIADLDLRKGGAGVYVLAEDQRLHVVAASSVRDVARAGNQVVVHTDPGSASSVAAAIDASAHDGVLGSIAGDDTILVIARDGDEAKRFQDNMVRLAGIGLQKG